MAKPSKKAGAAALQSEVTSDEEWERLSMRRGLVVVDVYSGWSGPCTAMVSTLRKIKMEIGGDALSYAVARSDGIAVLERFRGRSEPVWMFLQNGNMVNLVFGAHCPNLRRHLVDELRRVQLDEPPKWSLPVEQRGPEEEHRWRLKETIRKAREEEKMAADAAEKRARYEEFLDQETFELCEEVAIVVYPWVFIDEDGYPRDKEVSPAYTELARDILPERFDVLEQSRIQLDDENIGKLFVESGVVVTDDLIEGLTMEKCMAMRLKARPPPSEWPVPYPFECPEGLKRCPVRAIDDAENYLRSVLEAPPREEKRSVEGTYMERHVWVHEADPELEDDRRRIYPAVWFPPNARSKVHVFQTLFGAYMEKAHRYEEPVKPAPLCAFKFEASKFPVVSDAHRSYTGAVVCFGVFEYDAPSIARRVASDPDDFENKVKYKTGNEIFVIVLRRVTEEAFLAFAGNEPFYVTEDNDETERMIQEYFPPGAVDVLPEDPDEEEDYYDYEEEEEEEEEYEDEFEDEADVPPSIVDLSMF